MKKENIKNTNLLLVTTLGFALGMRQMAMTMVMPFISTYSKQLKYYTPVLAGVALGIFGLMQAVFQIFYGIWSDKQGNKRVMLCGLMQVVIGLVIAHFADNIYALIFARAMQGSGAVIAVGYSWVSGVCTNSKERLKSLSIISMMVSGAAAASFALGSIINKFVSVENMFMYSAVIILGASIVIALFLKDNKNVNNNNISTKHVMKILIKDKCFDALNIAGLLNNFIMTGVFFCIPQYLENITGLDGMWKVFMPSVIIAIIVIQNVVKKCDNVKSIKFLIINFILTAVGVLFYLNKSSFILILIGTILFMSGYIGISTVVSNLGNDLLANEYRGAGNGILNSVQYIGSFIGSLVVAKIWSISEIYSFIVLCIAGIAGAVIVKTYVKKERFNER